jgi:hypothetical protein
MGFKLQHTKIFGYSELSLRAEKFKFLWVVGWSNILQIGFGWAVTKENGNVAYFFARHNWNLL